MDDYKPRSSSSSSYAQRSQSGANMQLDFYYGNNNNNTKNNWYNNRSYSLDTYHNNNNIHNPQFQQNHANNSNVFDTQIPYSFDNKLKKSKTISTSKVWCFSDPEFKRKKRVASYRAYTVEGKVKRSFKSSFSWLKEKFINGFW